MNIVRNNFEFIYSTDCDLSPPKIDVNMITVEVGNLGVTSGHPLSKGKELLMITKCTMRFKGVLLSERVVHEYKGEPSSDDGFKDSYLVSDIQETEGEGHMYEFEGVIQNPLAWVDWKIKAKSFELAVAETS
ncbi:MAG: hypothetical protein JKY52_16820 [Flavobacteriales bacterium]|nr:hypothetical protein [Flavobacteriales bacterium]